MNAPHFGNKRISAGFTLIELLVVIMVIGILATMSVTRYVNVRDKARVATAAYDLDLVRKLLAYYSVDYSTYPLAIDSWADLQVQLVDKDGHAYGQLPVSNTFVWLTYSLDADNQYIMRVQASDNQQTVLKVTPDGITIE